MTEDAEPTGPRSLGLCTLVVLGAVTGLGGVSGATMGRDQLAKQLGVTPDVGLALYAVVTGVLVVGLLAALGLLRWWRRWPFDGDVAPAALPAWVVAAAVAGAGIGGYSMLVRDPDEPTHPAGMFAFFVLLPLALLACTLGVSSRRSAGLVVALMLAVEVSAQLGWRFGPEQGTFYFDDITIGNAVVLAICLAFVGLVALARRLSGR